MALVFSFTSPETQLIRQSQQVARLELCYTIGRCLDTPCWHAAARLKIEQLRPNAGECQEILVARD
jgi:hypothetical protein